MLKGERVLLRPYTRADMETQLAFSNDVEVELAGGGDPPMPHTLEAWQNWYDETIVKGGSDAAFFVIETDGKPIGMCVLHHMDLLSRNGELGIAIGEKAYWGRGYGREVVRLLLDYGFRLRNLRKIWLSTQSNNERALRCYTACGFVEEGRQRDHIYSNGAYHDMVYMCVWREAWKDETGNLP